MLTRIETLFGEPLTVTRSERCTSSDRQSAVVLIFATRKTINLITAVSKYIVPKRQRTLAIGQSIYNRVCLDYKIPSCFLQALSLGISNEPVREIDRRILFKFVVPGESVFVNNETDKIRRYKQNEYLRPEQQVRALIRTIVQLFRERSLFCSCYLFSDTRSIHVNCLAHMQIHALNWINNFNRKLFTGGSESLMK